jgi:hypothetical protein
MDSKLTKAEQLQRAFHLYTSEHGHLPSGAREVAEWAVRKGLIKLPQIDPYDVLSGDMAKALREEFKTDEKGRKYRVNHSVRVTKSGVHYTFWADINFAPHEHIQLAFTQRREQIVSDCVQLKIDLDVYNDKNKDKQIQLVFDFTEDVEEQQPLHKGGKKEAA